MFEREIENYWDMRSENFGRVRRLELSGENGKAWSEIIQKNLPKGKSLKVLDVGTGAGFFAAILAKSGHKVIGIDLSQKMLDEAEKIFHEQKIFGEFAKMNAQELIFDDETFDVVISRNLTWTLPDVMQAYREWYRVLKFGGVLMNFDSDYGDKNFMNEKTCARSDVPEKMIIECNEIKNKLRISTHSRPNWDVEFLRTLNFSVKFEEDISEIVHKDKIDYDSVPLFAIYAEK